MPSVVTTAHLQTKNKEARDNLISIFKEITEYSRVNENPGVIRYITAVPIDPPNETSIYMIEEYASQAASDAHLQTPPVQKLIAEFGASEPLIGAPEIFNLNPSVGFQRPTTSTPELIVLSHFGFKSGKAAAALEGWKSLAAYTEKNEKPVAGYTVTLDDKNETIRTVEVYESAKFFDEVHVKSEGVRANQKQNGADRTGEKGVVKLKAVQGFFGR